MNRVPSLLGLLLLAAGSAACAAPLAVHVAALTRGGYRPAVTVLGRLHGAPPLALRAPYTALMGQWLAPLGMRVAAGTVLARLWPVTQAHTVAALRAQDEAAATRVRQGLVLARQGLISRARLRVLQAAAARARADLAGARTRLAHGVLRAPFAGTVRYAVAPGTWLTPGQTVGQLDGTGPMYCTAALTEAAAHAVGTGAAVRLAGHAHARGHLYAFGAHLDDMGLVTAYIAGLPTRRRPGAVLRLEILGPPHRAWRLPQSALILADGRPQVFRLAGDHVEPVFVTILARADGRAYVAGALRAGMRIVTDHVSRLAPGVTVRVAP